MQNLLTFAVVVVVGVAFLIIRQPVTGLYNDPDVRTLGGDMRMHYPLTINDHKIRRHLVTNLEVHFHRLI